VAFFVLKIKEEYIMKYHNITKNDMLNGDGLRAVLWVAGCEHHCPECQNPETWDINGGIPFDETAKKELFHELEKSYVDGITLTGGDPLHPDNRIEILALIKEIHHTFPEKTIWIYTGYNYEDICKLEIMDYADVIVDGEYKKEFRNTSLHWCGSENQRVIDVKRSKDRNTICLWKYE
jgi:anaerobic ribonucleoside-triphosphate reductase activating protein